MKRDQVTRERERKRDRARQRQRERERERDKERKRAREREKKNLEEYTTLLEGKSFHQMKMSDPTQGHSDVDRLDNKLLTSSSPKQIQN